MTATDKPASRTPDLAAFIDGALYAAQVVALQSGEPTIAGDIFRDSGFTQATWLAAQRRSGYRSREMCRHIRDAFKSGIDSGGRGV